MNVYAALIVWVLKEDLIWHAVLQQQQQKVIFRFIFSFFVFRKYATGKKKKKQLPLHSPPCKYYCWIFLLHWYVFLLCCIPWVIQMISTRRRFRFITGQQLSFIFAEYPPSLLSLPNSPLIKHHLKLLARSSQSTLFRSIHFYPPPPPIREEHCVCCCWTKTVVSDSLVSNLFSKIGIFRNFFPSFNHSSFFFFSSSSFLLDIIICCIPDVAAHWKKWQRIRIINFDDNNKAGKKFNSQLEL